MVSDADAVPEYPILIRERLSATVGMSGYFGRLVVTPGEARFEPAGFANKVNAESPPTIRHREPVVVVVYGRFGLPWMNTGLVLSDTESVGQFTATLSFPAWQRKTVVASLRRAGFAVEVYRTGFSAGGRIGTVTELQQFRRQHRASR